MKSIKQIFKDNPDLMDDPEVGELIDYCRELESQVMETTQTKVWSQEDKLAEAIRDIYSSCNEELNQDKEADRWSDFSHVNFKESIINLKKFIQNFAKDNNFRL